jgi:two-component system, chemotaxis family, sensor kinase CheA
MDVQKEAYKVEAYELLAELETSLLELEQAPADADLVDRVFRAMHTIKGSGAMFGFDAIAEFTHDVESVYDRVREGRIAVTIELVNLSLRARDHIKSMLDNDHDPSAVDPHEGGTLLAGFRALLNADQAPSAGTADKPAPDNDPRVQPPAADAQIYRIRFSPHETLFQDGTNPLALLAELRELGDCRIIGHCDRLPPVQTFNPEACYLHWDILLATTKPLDAIRDVFIFAEDACALAIELIDIDLDA